METQNNESDEKTSKSFLGTIMTHNTTIIAIILSIGAMISNHYDQMEQNAYADSEEIQDERSNNDDRLSEAANKVELIAIENTETAISLFLDSNPTTEWKALCTTANDIELLIGDKYKLMTV